MKKLLLVLAAAALVAACGAKPKGDADGPELAGQTSGLDLAAIDPKVSASDNLERHFNGAWQDSVQLPPDHASIGPDSDLRDATLAQLKVLAQGAADTAGNPPGSEAQKIGDLYASFLDRGRLEPIGSRPLKDELNRIGKMRGKSELPVEIARLDEIGVTLPFSLRAGPSLKDPNHEIALLEAGGFNLPGPGYYVQERADVSSLRSEYLGLATRLLAMAGEKGAPGEASEALRVETALAGAAALSPASELPVTASTGDLAGMVPGFDWTAYFRSAGINGHVDEIAIARPATFAGVGKVLADEPLSAWQAYLKWQLVNAYAPYLSGAFADDSAGFYSRLLRGVDQPESRDVRATALVSALLGDAIGKLYVATNFQDPVKDRALAFVGNIKDAFRQSISEASWLSADARQHSLDKLDKLQVKVGYPEFWKDYSSVSIARDDLVGNVMHGKKFEYLRITAKIGQFRDRDEWAVAPQGTRVRYDRATNELLVPAAVLQPSYFNPAADDAVNFGRLGVLIAHELSHGFDAVGSHYEASGQMGDLWSEADRRAFDARTRPLVAMYGAYEMLPGTHIDGERTLAENIADVAGLTIAFRASRLAHPAGGRIDDLSANQRFFGGWVQLMRQKSRQPEILRILLGSDVVPQPLRGNVPVSLQSAYYTSFDVKPASLPFRPVNQRIQLW